MQTPGFVPGVLRLGLDKGSVAPAAAKQRRGLTSAALKGAGEIGRGPKPQNLGHLPNGQSGFKQQPPRLVGQPVL